MRWNYKANRYKQPVMSVISYFIVTDSLNLSEKSMICNNNYMLVVKKQLLKMSKPLVTTLVI